MLKKVKEFGNLLCADGFSFTGVGTSGKKLTGKISVEGNNAYLCQNTQEGAECEDKKGYVFSWSVSKGTPANIKSNGIKEFQLFYPKGVTELPESPTSEIGGWEVSITFDRKLAFGCGAIILDVPTVKKIIKAKKQYIAVKDELDELTQEYNRVKAALEARIRLTGDLKDLLTNVKENYKVDVIKGVELKQLENLLIHKELQDVKSKSNS
jgi:hypothetical protein